MNTSNEIAGICADLLNTAKDINSTAKDYENAIKTAQTRLEKLLQELQK